MPTDSIHCTATARRHPRPRGRAWRAIRRAAPAALARALAGSIALALFTAAACQNIFTYALAGAR